MTLIFYRTKSRLRSERFAWYMRAINGKKLARAEGFTNREDCEHNAEMVTNFRNRSGIIVEYRW